ncbi:splicing factor U2af large subunit B isoform X3 [Selaginella moellendorffii]|uniref:splicing factor U2af large subunit B isoform X3 n=1 Tax=Selaginella moellendorffii TaxID=88036 RepID=UPI000D1C97BA|nr:splicing factor U2af large subunit B isoform X3 [Selaginella moellendorffii]|eukprot:XP_024521327.1 splicing factor U2af large subunit B isoform X3 [Selaginella moellendorffii]
MRMVPNPLEPGTGIMASQHITMAKRMAAIAIVRFRGLYSVLHRKSREREKSRERDDRRHRDDRDRRNDRERDYDRDRDRERDRDERHKTRDRERRRSRDRDRERERRHRHRSRSRSKGRSRDRSKSRSRSRSRDRRSRGSKRTSGFDMAPPGAAVVTGTTPGQLPGITQPVPGVFSMFPFAGTQFAGLPTMPAQAMTQQATRHARRVYVGGLPPLANEQVIFSVRGIDIYSNMLFNFGQTIATFFSQVMSAIGGNTAGPGDAVVNVYINQEKKFAFVEMRTVEEASNAMALDGIIFEGVSVRVRRPSDYNPSMAATLGPSQPSPHLNLAAVGLTPGAAGGADGPDRIFVGGLPYYLTEGQIKELLESFGPLRGFDLVKDRDTGNSKGYGFCVYQDPAVTDVACAALNGLKMGDKTLTVRRATASVHSGQPKPDQANVLAQAQQQIALQKLALQGAPYYNMMMPGVDNGMTMPETPTKVVCLKQVVSPDELKEDDEYEEILEDMREECGKYGSVATLVLPRPKSNGEEVAGVGKVFVEYATIEEAIKAKNSLNGRKFGGNIVAAVYFPEDKFLQGEYNVEPASS